MTTTDNKYLSELLSYLDELQDQGPLTGWSVTNVETGETYDQKQGQTLFRFLADVAWEAGQTYGQMLAEQRAAHKHEAALAATEDAASAQRKGED